MAEAEAPIWGIYENAWIVSKTEKPIATIPLSRTDGEALRKRAKEMADELGICMVMVVSDDEGADVEFPAAQLCFYREQIIFDAYLYLESDEADDIPEDVLDCLRGSRYGYRSDAIQQYVDWQQSRRSQESGIVRSR